MNELWKYVSAALAAGAMLLGVGRYVGNLEQRINQLERQSEFMHGDLRGFLPVTKE